MTDVAVVLDAVRDALPVALGQDLMALLLHGSLQAGDFAPGRSDVDLLAVLATEPDAALERTAYRHLGDERLAAAVGLAERLATEPDAAVLLRELDAQSLRWRGKPAKAA